MDISSVERIYFVGIKGVAMTSLAIYAKQRGIIVSGSDTPEVFPTQEALKKSNITPLIGFYASHVTDLPKPDLVVYTGAHDGKNNIEVRKALEERIPCVSHAEALGMCMKDSFQVSVAGSHGKTTASAMIATILSDAGRNPSWAIGCGGLRPLGFPGHYGKGREFVAEADEYVTDKGHDLRPRFHWQAPDLLVVTNIDFDHPDVYKNVRAVKQAFLSFQLRQKGIATTIVNSDDPQSEELVNRTVKRVILYGTSRNADLQIQNVTGVPGETQFELKDKDTKHTMKLHVPGMHNVLNAAAATAACLALGVSWENISQGLSKFEGTKRRFELVGEKSGISLYDDYAHHPSEIEAMLAGIRQWYKDAYIITIFQPHTYSRTKALLDRFARCFDQSDIVGITDIYSSARETDTLGMTGPLFVKKVGQYHKNCFYIKNLERAIAFVKNHAQPKTIVLTMGAGNIFQWGPSILQGLG